LGDNKNELSRLILLADELVAKESASLQPDDYLGELASCQRPQQVDLFEELEHFVGCFLVCNRYDLLIVIFGQRGKYCVLLGPDRCSTRRCPIRLRDSKGKFAENSADTKMHKRHHQLRVPAMD